MAIELIDTLKGVFKDVSHSPKKPQMKKTIEELAWEYIASIAGTDPNLDISQYEADYNAFIAGANAVLDGQEQKEECTHPRDKRVYVGRGMLRCTLCDEEFS